MSDPIVGRTRAGTPYTPEFVIDLNQSTCIGCGRCFKVCSRDVFELVTRESEDDDDDDDEMMVMSLANAGDCIGCGACSRVCPKNCHTHSTAAA